jgi:hypothetical protein
MWSQFRALFVSLFCLVLAADGLLQNELQQDRSTSFKSTLLRQRKQERIAQRIRAIDKRIGELSDPLSPSLQPLAAASPSRQSPSRQTPSRQISRPNQSRPRPPSSIFSVPTPEQRIEENKVRKIGDRKTAGILAAITAMIAAGSVALPMIVGRKMENDVPRNRIRSRMNVDACMQSFQMQRPYTLRIRIRATLFQSCLFCRHLEKFDSGETDHGIWPTQIDTCGTLINCKVGEQTFPNYLLLL